MQLRMTESILSFSHVLTHDVHREKFTSYPRLIIFSILKFSYSTKLKLQTNRVLLSYLSARTSDKRDS